MDLKFLFTSFYQSSFVQFFRHFLVVMVTDMISFQFNCVSLITFICCVCITHCCLQYCLLSALLNTLYPIFLFIVCSLQLVTLLLCDTVKEKLCIDSKRQHCLSVKQEFKIKAIIQAIGWASNLASCVGQACMRWEGERMLDNSDWKTAHWPF